MKNKKKRGGLVAWLWLLLLLPLVYLAVQIYSSTNRPYRTETATLMTLVDSVEAKGVVVRQESLVPMSGTGVLGYTVGNVERVSAGTEVAEVFDSAASAQNFARATQLATEIQRLKDAQQDGLNAGTNVQNILGQQKNEIYRLISLDANGLYTGLNDIKNNITYYSNKLAIAVGIVADFDAQIAALQQEYDACSAAGQPSAAVSAPQTGYFFYDADGYENLTPDTLAGMDADAVDSLPTSFLPADTAGSAGKMVTDYKWYYVCTVDTEEAKHFSEGQSVNLDFTDSGVSGLPATVEGVSEPSSGGRVKITLCCEEVRESLSYLRFETARIEFATYTGIRISRSALHINKDGQTGVYIKFGTMLLFRGITPIFETDTYVLVPATASDSTGVNQVKVYDEIITEGSDLEDKKLI